MTKRPQAHLEEFRGLPFANFPRQLDRIQLLKGDAASGASRLVLTTASAYTKWAFSEFQELGKQTLTYLQYCQTEFARTSRDIDGLASHFADFTDMIAPDDDVEARDQFSKGMDESLEQYRLAILRYIHARQAYDRVRAGTALEVLVELSRELFEDIMAPGRATFHMDSVREVLVIALSKVPVFGTITDLAQLPRLISPQERMREYLEGGDRVLSYFEEYSEGLLDWVRTARAFAVVLETERGEARPPVEG
jgi:hypothetical protein